MTQNKQKDVFEIGFNTPQLVKQCSFGNREVANQPTAMDCRTYLAD